MVELLFLLAFAGVLFFTGISIVGMALAVAVGFVVMAVAGMIGMVFKLLPWLILIAWWCGFTVTVKVSGHVTKR
ncbi:probable exported protein YPO0318 [Photobacterium aphoticum]|uniref:Probable exported protein YPO0318 n=1 Tax=Photobacterium aphoticum TaxID=754436 RepID=A0A090R2R1_9GAMM|nr:probable exported protein YPO0318 [Photobacterium aphoticum]